MVIDVCAVVMGISFEYPVISKGAESASVTAFPAAAAIVFSSEVQLAVVLALSALVITVPVLLLMVLGTVISTAAAAQARA
jgi:hypothetical protein